MSKPPPKRKKRPADFNQRAYQVFQEAIGETLDDESTFGGNIAALTPDESANEKNPAAVELGRLGGSKGGKARAQKLAPEQRSAIAKRAAQARWNKRSGGSD